MQFLQHIELSGNSDKAGPTCTCAEQGVNLTVCACVCVHVCVRDCCRPLPLLKTRPYQHLRLSIKLAPRVMIYCLTVWLCICFHHTVYTYMPDAINITKTKVHTQIQESGYRIRLQICEQFGVRQTFWRCALHTYFDHCCLNSFGHRNVHFSIWGLEVPRSTTGTEHQGSSWDPLRLRHLPVSSSQSITHHPPTYATSNPPRCLTFE